MREITYASAIREALQEEMRVRGDVFLLGEDIGRYGGLFGVTQGLLDEFGEDRVRDTPISEAGIVGAAIGAAITGMRPVGELMFCDFAAIAMDQIANQAAKMRYMFGGQISVSLVLRVATGAGGAAGAQHSQALHAWFVHVPGLKVVMPSTPYDAKGLLKASIADENPVVFLEHKMLYKTSGPVPEGHYTVPLGKGDIKRRGKDVTIVAVSIMVRRALEAAGKLAEQGIEAEVVDPRTLRPLDVELIVESVKRTRRALVVDEGAKTCGVGAEILAIIVEQAFDYLDAPVERVCALDVPIPLSPPLERRIVPTDSEIAAAVRRLVG